MNDSDLTPSEVLTYALIPTALAILLGLLLGLAMNGRLTQLVSYDRTPTQLMAEKAAYKAQVKAMAAKLVAARKAELASLTLTVPETQPEQPTTPPAVTASQDQQPAPVAPTTPLPLFAATGLHLNAAGRRRCKKERIEQSSPLEVGYRLDEIGRKHPVVDLRSLAGCSMAGLMVGYLLSSVCPPAGFVVAWMAGTFLVAALGS